MKRCLAVITWLTCLMQNVTSIKCAECDYLPHTLISGIRTCPRNCYGEICYIVVNNYYNETLVSGCVNVDTETRTFFRNHAYCHRKKEYTVCGCTTSDRCNSPQAPFSMFTFIDTPFFEDCQLVPKNADTDSNSFQANITSKGNDSQTESLNKSQCLKDSKTTNLTSPNNATVNRGTACKMEVEDSSNSDSEKSVESLSTFLTRPITAHPSTIYPVENKVSISAKHNKNKIRGEVIDELARSLLPSLNYYRITNPQANYSKFHDEKIEETEIRYDDNSSNRQYEFSRSITLLIFCCLSYCYQFLKLNFKATL